MQVDEAKAGSSYPRLIAGEERRGGKVMMLPQSSLNLITDLFQSYVENPCIYGILGLEV